MVLKTKIPLAFCLIFQGITILSCKTTEFSANSDAKSLRTTNGSGEIYFKCEDFGKQPEKRSMSVSGPEPKVSVKADICADIEAHQEKAQLDVYLVLDTSGSMRDNDPIANGSCGRFKVLQQMITSDVFKAYPKVTYSIISFATNAYDKANEMTAKDLKNFKAEEICQQQGHTNYKEAFDRVFDKIKDKSGQKLVFLISDGLPTHPMQQQLPYQKIFISNEASSAEVLGVESAEKIRQQASTSVYAVFLAPNSGVVVNHRKTSPVENPLEYLAQITGDKDRVASVNQASQLETKVAEFSKEFSAQDGVHTPKVQLVVAGGGNRDFDIEILNKSTKAENPKWELATKSIELQQKPGTEATYNVEMIVTTKENKKLKASKELTVTYTEK